MLRKCINYFISKIKGEQFILDKRIPLTYLFNFIIEHFISLFFGILKFRTLKLVFVHFSSHIKCASKIQIGKNLRIDRKCDIDALSTDGVIFGSNVSIGEYTTIMCSGTLKSLGKGLKVGNNVGLGTHGFFGCAGGIIIGDDTIFGNYVSIHSENHNYSNKALPIRLQGVNHKGVVIGNNCWIGAKVTILDGTVIGNGCIIAAGSVVRGYISDNSIVGGVPCKFIKNRFEK